MEEWAVLTPAAKNQKFNVCDDSNFTFEAFWPRLAGWYGLDWKGPDPDAKYIEVPTPYNPRGYGPNSVYRARYTFVNWAKRGDVQKSWKKLAQEHGLSPLKLQDINRVFGFLDSMLSRAGPLMYR